MPFGAPTCQPRRPGAARWRSPMLACAHCAATAWRCTHHGRRFPMPAAWADGRPRDANSESRYCSMVHVMGSMLESEQAQGICPPMRGKRHALATVPECHAPAAAKAGVPGRRSEPVVAGLILHSEAG
eukprot:360076-Chlamydomonas_euryale.AAC.2